MIVYVFETFFKINQDVTLKWRENVFVKMMQEFRKRD